MVARAREVRARDADLAGARDGHAAEDGGVLERRLRQHRAVAPRRGEQPPNVGGVLDASPRIVALAATAAGVGPFAGRLMMMRAVRTLPAATSALFGLASPVLTVGTAWLFLDTLPSLREVLAGVVVLGGLVLALSPTRPVGVASIPRSAP